MKINQESQFVVTGAKGFIGKHLCILLREKGKKVKEWDIPEIDMTDSEQVKDAMDRDQPEIIYHLASTGVSSNSAHDHLVIGKNVQMIANIISYAKKGTIIIIAGSMSEYGVSGILREDMVCSPMTAYGIAKLATTNYAIAYGPKNGINVIVARLFGVYGPGENEERLFPTIIHGLKRGEEIYLSDGEQRRDFIYVLDACETIIRLGEYTFERADIINVGTGNSVKVKDVVYRIADEIGVSHSLLKFGKRKRSPGDADLLEADVRKLITILKWCPPQRFKNRESIIRLFMEKN